MKILYKLFLLVLPAIGLFSCNQEIDHFDNSENYIYFNMPFFINQYGSATEERVDSIVHSFALDNSDIIEYTFKIPVNTVGLGASFDRSYKVEVITDSTNATAAEWDVNSISNRVIKSGMMQDTLYVTVNRTKVLQSAWRHIQFRIFANEYFKLGDRDLQTAKISFSDILTKPVWWDPWYRTFGEYSREKFKKWQEIYYLGADPNVETATPAASYGKPLYWDNMPYSPNKSSSYPSTFMFIKKLKQYFIDNEVYPDGDTSKPRIAIP